MTKVIFKNGYCIDFSRMSYSIFPDTWKMFLNEAGDISRFAGRLFKEAKQTACIFVQISQ